MNTQFVSLMTVLAVLFGSMDAASMAGQCSTELQKVTTCLTFATGKAATPTKDCCSAVTSIKDSNPVCLCYIMEQIHNGTNPQLKSIQEDRLLQLPSACKLANATSSDCPKLLHLPPNSPEAAIFTNVTGSTSPSTPATGTPSSSSTTSSPSDGYKSVPQLPGSTTIAMAVIFFFAMFT